MTLQIDLTQDDNPQVLDRQPQQSHRHTVGVGPYRPRASPGVVNSQYRPLNSESGPHAISGVHVPADGSRNRPSRPAIGPERATAPRDSQSHGSSHGKALHEPRARLGEPDSRTERSHKDGTGTLSQQASSSSGLLVSPKTQEANAAAKIRKKRPKRTEEERRKNWARYSKNIYGLPWWEQAKLPASMPNRYNNPEMRAMTDKIEIMFGMRKKKEDSEEGASKNGTSHDSVLAALQRKQNTEDPKATAARLAAAAQAKRDIEAASPPVKVIRGESSRSSAGKASSVSISSSKDEGISRPPVSRPAMKASSRRVSVADERRPFKKAKIGDDNSHRPDQGIGDRNVMSHVNATLEAPAGRVTIPADVNVPARVEWTIVDGRPVKLQTSSARSQVPQQSVQATLGPQRDRPAIPPAPHVQSKHGLPYSQQEDDLLYDLRKAGRPWEEIINHFQGRTMGSLQVRFSTKVSRRDVLPPLKTSARPGRPTKTVYSNGVSAGESASPGFEAATGIKPMKSLRRRTVGGASRQEAQMSRRRVCDIDDDDGNPRCAAAMQLKPAIAGSLRYRWQAELGGSVHPNRSRSWAQTQLKNHAFETMKAERYIEDASGDVATIAWSPDGHAFAAGAVVLSDENSMQYNRPRNLYLGDSQGVVREMPDHHTQRPVVEKGVNSLASMRSTQDPRLFQTVQKVEFAPDSKHMYAVSLDGKLIAYNTNNRSVRQASKTALYQHSAPVDLLSISRNGLIATGSRTSTTDNIGIYSNTSSTLSLTHSFRPASGSSDAPIYPSALKWGVAPHQSRFLLSGFAQEKQLSYSDDDRLDILGSASLFDASTGTVIPLSVTRNVFDVAWNPRLGHTAFALACVGAGRLNPGMCTVVRLFGEGHGGMRCKIDLECPAHDINDVIYSPFDDNLIAAGSTDGKVYVWDTRYTKHSQDPLRRLSHGSCLSVLPHERKRWETDTGVRFLSWAATGNRLWSGSSDGIVKVWDPYVAEEDSHVKDVARFESAIMSGAFRPDYEQLLIGEDRGRLSLLRVGADEEVPPRPFEFVPAPELDTKEDSERPWREWLDSERVIFESAGPLPIRQAVQGPNYDFARLMTEKEAELYAESQKFQRDLFWKRNAWKKLRRDLPGPKPKPCTLDCGFLPRGGEMEEDDGVWRVPVEDSRRSEGRIPDGLRGEQIKGREAMMKGLVAKCKKCGAPALPADSEGDEVRCEKCEFGCFRCGRPVDLDLRADEITCAACGIRWRADLLGYTILEEGMSNLKIEDPHGGAHELSDHEQERLPGPKMDLDSDDDEIPSKMPAGSSCRQQ